MTRDIFVVGNKAFWNGVAYKIVKIKPGGWLVLRDWPYEFRVRTSELF